MLINLQGHTKYQIKSFLREELQKHSDAGKEILLRRLRNWKLEFNDTNLKKLLKFFKLKSVTDLYAAIAEEKIDISLIKEQLLDKPEIVKMPERIDEDLVEKIIKPQSTGKEDFLIIDEKAENLEYKLSKCCNPIFGDSIFGFVTINEGIKIHRINCPNAEQLISKYGYRIVNARWTTNDGKSHFQVNIKIVGTNDIGLVSRITDTIAKDLKVNMRSISINTNDGMFEGNLSLFVKDTAHLDALINKLKKIKGVLSAGRLASV